MVNFRDSEFLTDLYPWQSRIDHWSGCSFVCLFVHTVYLKKLWMDWDKIFSASSHLDNLKTIKFWILYTTGKGSPKREYFRSTIWIRLTLQQLEVESNLAQ